MIRIIEKLSAEQIEFFESGPEGICGPGGGGNAGERIVPIGSRMTTLETKYLDSDHWSAGSSSEKNKMNDQEAKDLEDVRSMNPEWVSFIEAGLFAKEQNRQANEGRSVPPIEDVEDILDDPAKLRDAFKKAIRKEVDNFIFNSYIPHLYPGKTKDDPKVAPYVGDLFMKVNDFVNKEIIRCRKRDSADFKKLEAAQRLVCSGEFTHILRGRFLKNG